MNRNNAYFATKVTDIDTHYTIAAITLFKEGR